MKENNISYLRFISIVHRLIYRAISYMNFSLLVMILLKYSKDSRNIVGLNGRY